jgi:two-component system sensor histidine kinase and response regulator WspE
MEDSAMEDSDSGMGTEINPNWSNLPLLELFRLEMESQARILSQNLLGLEQILAQLHPSFPNTHPPDANSLPKPDSQRQPNSNGNSDNLDSLTTVLTTLMRATHSIKGAARVVQVELVVRLAHAMEDGLVVVQGDYQILGGAMIEELLQGADWLMALSQHGEPGLLDWLETQTQVVDNRIQGIATLLADRHDSQPNSQHDSQSNTTPGPNESSAALVPIAPNDSGPTQNSSPIPLARELAGELQPDSAPSLELASGPNLVVTPPYNFEQQGWGQQSLDRPPEVPLQPLVHPDSLSLELMDRAGHPQTISPTPTESGTTDRRIQISAANLSRLMALAGESVVEANWLQPFAESLLQLKQQQQALAQTLERLNEKLHPASTHSQIDVLVPSLLTEAQVQLETCHQVMGTRLQELDQFSRRFVQLSDGLYREVLACHMCPFGNGVQGLNRLVRDLAKKLGKQVQFEIVGTATQVDRDILQKLETPLTHLLQNAVGHGIESPAERQAAGKGEQGKIRLEAIHRAGMLSITVQDDGRGIDPERLRQKVLHKQLTTPEVVAQLTNAELMEFLFLPGFSTAGELTEISGRGFGLDVAKTMAQEVGGLLRAFSRPGQGMTFQFQLPLTLSVIRALLVEIGGEPYAFALMRIDRVLKFRRQDICVIENRQYGIIDGQNIGLVAAEQVLGVSPNPDENQEELCVIVMSDLAHQYGVIVDRFLGEQDLVVRPLDERLGKVPNISAAALMDDGTPVLIVDVADWVRSIDQLVCNGRLHGVPSELPQISPDRKRILVVDDSITVREMERKLLENQGYHVDVAVDGIEGWNTVSTKPYDLVISDIDMPRMDGIELIGKIKTHPKLNHIPVVIVSYKDRHGDKLAGLHAGANYYLTKSSFHDNSLIHAVTDLIGGGARDC